MSGTPSREARAVTSAINVLTHEGYRELADQLDAAVAALSSRLERAEAALKANADEAEAILQGGVLVSACAIRIRDRALAALGGAAVDDGEPRHCTLACTGPWHRPECALAGHARRTVMQEPKEKP